MSEFLRTRNSFEGKEKSKRLYPPIPETLELGTYDNHTHLEIADGDEPLSVAQHLDLMR